METALAKHRYVTIERESPDHDRYLSGQFSSSELAIPVTLLEGTPSKENTTFQIYGPGQIKRPSLALVFLQLLRFDLIGLTLLPAFVVYMFTGGTYLSVGVLTCSLACVHAATFAFNDYYDHMHGRDRLSEVSGSRVIQEGFLRAHEVFKVALMFSFLAGAGAVYFALQNPKILIFAALGLALFAIGTLYSRLGLKSSGMGDLAVLIGLGPLFTTAVEYSLIGQMTSFIFYIGLVYGLLSLLYVQSKSLVTSMVDHQAGVRTLAVRVGFDRMKKFMLVELVIMIGIAIKLEPVLSFSFGLFLVGLLWLARLVRRLPSPVSSRTQSLARHVLIAHALWSLSLLFHYAR